jgi:glycosyltransferase involved in cell wall biosynthesis
VTRPKVVVVALGRATLGETRRVESWRAIFGAADAEVTVVELLTHHRANLRSVATQVGGVVGGRTVPETLAWSQVSLRRQLNQLEPDVVVAVTTRAFSAGVAAAARRVVLDFVDPLSISYRDRARLEERLHSKARYRALAPFHERIERSAGDAALVRTAAGWSDAKSLSAEWVPNVVELHLTHAVVQPRYDVLFVGSLYFAPNVEALERLAEAWPRVAHERPGVTALVAGRAPSPRVTELAKLHGWTLQADFDDIADVTSQARIAVAPLVRASGIQNKVLEAAAFGLPQVVSPQALAGLRPGFPAEVAARQDELGPLIAALLADQARQAELHDAGIEEVRRTYVPEAWTDWAQRLIGG